MYFFFIILLIYITTLTAHNYQSLGYIGVQRMTTRKIIIVNAGDRSKQTLGDSSTAGLSSSALDT